MADSNAGKIRVGIIFGGQSAEHEVSRVSAESVLQHIDTDKYDIEVIGINREGKWLAYKGDYKLIGTGEWESVAEDQALRRRAESLKLMDAKTQKSNIGSNMDLVNSARGILKNAGAEAGGRKLDVVFPVLHGTNGEDGTVQGLLELAGLPYIGSGILGSALGMDKAYAKMLFERAGLTQGRYLVFSRKQIECGIDGIADMIEDKLGYPNFIKPSNTGSSVGVSKAHGRAELVTALKYASRFDRKVLAEEFIDGREVECAVLGNDDPIASTVGEVKPCNEFYDYAAKYASDSGSSIIIPADLPPAVMEIIRDTAVKAFKVLDCAGMARVDFFVQTGTDKVLVNEVNTIPGFTSISMYPKLWEASGIGYTELIDRLIDLAIERYEDGRREYGFNG